MSNLHLNKNTFYRLFQKHMCPTEQSLLNASFTSCRRSGHICDICTIKFTKETHYNFKPISSCMKSKRKCVPAITLPTQFRTRAKTKNQLCFLPLLTSSLHRMESCSFSYQIKLLMGAHGNGGDYGVCAVPTWRAANVHWICQWTDLCLYGGCNGST